MDRRALLDHLAASPVVIFGWAMGSILKDESGVF
jgi:hypothetical protein